MNKCNENLIKAIIQFDKEFNKPVSKISHGEVYDCDGTKKEYYELDALTYDISFTPTAKKTYYFGGIERV